MHLPSLSARLRLLRLAGAALAVVLVAVVVALATGGGDHGASGPAEVGARGAAYAAQWQATCTALTTDAQATTARTRRALPRRGAPSRGRARRIARSVVVPYLGRTERRLRRIAAASPPPEWRAYHAAARPLIDATRSRALAVRRLVRSGRIDALRDLDLTRIGRSPRAPEELRRRTPACTRGS